MAKVTLKISEFQPVRTNFPIYDSDGNELPGCENIWLNLIPPTFKEDKLRGDLIRAHYYRGGMASLTNPRVLMAEEIWLTFGGTNLEAELPKLDDKNEIVYKKSKEGLEYIETELVAFPENGKTSITKEEFMERLNKLPEYVVQSWYKLVIEKVAKDWIYPF